MASDSEAQAARARRIADLLADCDRPLVARPAPGGVEVVAADAAGGREAIVASVPAAPPASFGDPAFRAAHDADWAYVAGAMAGGIASEELVIAMANAGLLAFFGSGGLERSRVERAIARIRVACPGRDTWGCNLLPNPLDPREEDDLVSLYLARGVRRLSASAFMQPSLPLVRYRTHGLHAGADGTVIAPNRLIAKISRTEVARSFMEPPPASMLAELARRGELDASQVALAARIPLAEDLDAEADSGGHTDRQPSLPLFAAIAALRDAIVRERGYPSPIRVGLAGGIGSPLAVAAAFAAGASHVVTGSINQASVEAGTSDAVKAMLRETDMGAVAMAPAADMFEMGVNVQVLRHRTLFAARARKLYDLYRSYASLDDVPAAARDQLEKQIFRRPLAAVWADTEAFFRTRDPAQIERAAVQPKHRMALLFRWYLGMSSRWARDGTADRTVDFQVWCGPAMGAFNEWVRGTALDPLPNRTVVGIAHNLMHGAAAVWRGRQLAQQLAAHGLALPPDAYAVVPRWPSIAPGRRAAVA